MSGDRACWWGAGLALGACAGGACAGPTFGSMGQLGTGSTVTSAHDVSADGLWAVGTSGASGYMWSEPTGMVRLHAGPGGTNPVSALITGVSNGGQVAVGSREIIQGPTFPVRWTFEHGMEDLGDLPGGATFGRANDVSDDGAVVVGYSHSHLGPEAFVWRREWGLVPMGRLPGDNYSSAMDVSGDGGRVVGYSALTSMSATSITPCVWDVGAKIRPLGEPGAPGQFSSVASDISASGAYIAGHTREAGALFNTAVLWNPGGTFELLGTLPGIGTGSEAHGVSDQGHVVGAATTTQGLEAFLWTPDRGMRALEEVLALDYGLNLGGWSLQYAGAISADGTTIVGGGRDPEGRFGAWVAVIPAPASIAAIVPCGAALARRARHRT